VDSGHGFDSVSLYGLAKFGKPLKWFPASAWWFRSHG